MKRKRIPALLLCCAMLAGLLAGCGGEKEKPQNQIAYVPTYHSMEDNDFEINSVGYACSTSEYTYFIGYVPGGVDHYLDSSTGEMVAYETNTEALFRVKLDGTGLEKLPNFPKTQIPEDCEGGSYINSMGVTPDGGVWMLENVNTYRYDLPEDFDPANDEVWNYYSEGETQSLFHRMDADGNLLFTVDLKEMAAKASGDPEAYFYIYNVAVDKAGNIYFYDGQDRINVLDPQGELMFSIQDENIGGNMVVLSDGRVAGMTWGENRALKTIDLETKAWGEDLPVPTQWYNITNGVGDYLYCYSTSSSFFGCKSDGTSEKLFSWISCDLNQDDLTGLTVQSMDQLTAMELSWNREKQCQDCEFIVLDRKEIPPEEQKQVLTMAVMYLDWEVRNLVLAFNRANTEYRIEVQDYSEFNTEDDYSAGQTKLTAEILTGKMPDILVDDNQLPMRQYAAKGLLEDLLPYLDADAELGGREGLFQPVLNATLQEGKLYRLGATFAFSTAFANRRVVGDVTGWTAAEAKAALDKLPEGAALMSFWTTQDELINRVCSINLGRYINWDTGECTFDTGDFEKLLEFSTLAPKEVDYESYTPADRESTRIQEGRQLMQAEMLYDWYEMLYAHSNWGDNMALVGFPAEDREGNAFYLSSCFSMSSKCKYKDVAWQFIRTAVTKEEGSSLGWGFPMNQKALDAMMKEAMTPETYIDENGIEQVYSKVEYVSDHGERIQINCLSQEDYDMLMGAMERTTKLAEYDTTIMGIIMDEAQAFIDGNATAGQVAANVQNRVKLYVNEQR